MDLTMLQNAFAAAIQTLQGENPDLKLSDGDIERIAAAVSASAPAEPPQTDAVTIAEAFKAGAACGLEGKSLDRIAEAVKGGAAIADAIAREQELVAEFKEMFATKGDEFAGVGKQAEMKDRIAAEFYGLEG